MAKMLSTAGYWGSTCTSKCHWCNRFPHYNKTAMRRRERLQWLADADLDGGEPDSPWWQDSNWDNYEKEMIE